MKYPVVRHGDDPIHLPLVQHKERLRRLIDENKCASVMFAQYIEAWWLGPNPNRANASG